jgi:hypothetical protein
VNWETKHLYGKYLEAARDGSPVPDPTSRTDFPDTSEVLCRRNRARATALPQVSVAWSAGEELCQTNKCMKRRRDVKSVNHASEHEQTR